MSVDLRPVAPAPIAYNIEGACRATGLSEFVIAGALKRGTLTARYYGNKPLVGHADLLEWFNTFPLDKQEPGEARP